MKEAAACSCGSGGARKGRETRTARGGRAGRSGRRHRGARRTQPPTVEEVRVRKVKLALGNGVADAKARGQPDRTRALCTQERGGQGTTTTAQTAQTHESAAS